MRSGLCLWSKLLSCRRRPRIEAKRGGRARLEMCGEREKLCVRADKGVAFGKEADYFVLWEY